MIDNDNQIDLTVLITHVYVNNNLYCYHTLDVKRVLAYFVHISMLLMSVTQLALLFVGLFSTKE